jgi:hypothetical protein
MTSIYEIVTSFLLDLQHLLEKAKMNPGFHAVCIWLAKVLILVLNDFTALEAG